MVVILLLAVIWAGVLVPPAVRVHAARKDAFLDSFDDDRGPPPHSSSRSAPVQRRRRIAGGLLAAIGTTLVVGLLPTFRVLLVVHLFLVDSFLAYIALLAHAANRAARTAAPVPVAPEPAPAPAWRPWRRREPAEPRPAVLGELGPLALG